MFSSDDQDGSRKYRRKNKVSAWRNDFAKRKGNVPPTARGDAKWRDARVMLTLVGDKR